MPNGNEFQNGSGAAGGGGVHMRSDGTPDWTASGSNGAQPSQPTAPFAGQPSQPAGAQQAPSQPTLQPMHQATHQPMQQPAQMPAGAKPATPKSVRAGAAGGMSVCAVIGVVIAVVALVLAFIPLFNYLAFPIAIAGLVLAVIGIVGTVRRLKRGRIVGVLAAVINVGAFVTAFIMQSIYLQAAANAVNEAGEAVGGVDWGQVQGEAGTFFDGAVEIFSNELGIDVLPEGESASDALGNLAEDAKETVGDIGTAIDDEFGGWQYEGSVVTIDSVSVRPDISKRDSAVVAITWTNNDDKEHAFASSYLVVAEQNGQSLLPSVVEGLNDAPTHQSVAPGGTVTFEQSFSLSGSDPVTVKVVPVSYDGGGASVAETTADVYGQN